MDFEKATSKRSSRDDEAHELLKVVTHAVARLQLDWPQEKEQTLKVRADYDDAPVGRDACRLSLLGVYRHLKSQLFPPSRAEQHSCW